MRNAPAAYLLACLALTPAVALGQASTASRKTDPPEARIAPGSPIYATAIAVVSSTTTYAMSDAGATGYANHMPFAEGTRLVLTNLASDQDVVCTLSDNPTSQIGDVSAVATMADVTDGRTGVPASAVQGGTILIARGKARAVIVPVAPHLQGAELAGYRTGICSAPVIGSHTSQQAVTPETDLVRRNGWDVYIGCAADDECDDVAGTPSGATCLTTAAAIEAEVDAAEDAGARVVARGKHLGCRGTGSATLVVEIEP